MKSTEEQKERYRQCYYEGIFYYPCCQSGVVSELPVIQNKGDLKTQIYCVYCRQFIFLEDYPTEKAKRSGRY